MNHARMMRSFALRMARQERTGLIPRGGAQRAVRAMVVGMIRMSRSSTPLLDALIRKWAR